MWFPHGHHDENANFVKVIESKTKKDVCKSFLTFLNENSEIVITLHDNNVSIFKKDLDVQKVVAGSWF